MGLYTAHCFLRCLRLTPEISSCVVQHQQICECLLSMRLLKGSPVLLIFPEEMVRYSLEKAKQVKHNLTTCHWLDMWYLQYDLGPRSPQLRPCNPVAMSWDSTYHVWHH